MNREKKLKIGLAINHVAMAVPTNILTQIKPWLNQIEAIVAEEPTEDEGEDEKNSS